MSGSTVFRNFLRCVLAALLCCSVAHAQEDYTWWNELHQWDGVTPWNQYLTVSPKYFGPNALPVPEVRKGVSDSISFFGLSFGGHFSSGDRTADAVLQAAAALCKEKVSLACRVVPVEFYRMDTVTRDLRAARDRDGQGRAGGDIHFSTCVQLLGHRTELPEIALEVALRTASGTRLGAARYTDAPGYHMDLSIGKTFAREKPGQGALRPYAMIGFYSYQTFDVQQLQNDCVLYGGGCDWSVHSFVWSHQVAGYAGYRHDGDHPVVYRSEIRHAGKHVDALFQFQLGLHDFEYRSLHAGMVYRIPPEWFD